MDRIATIAGWLRLFIEPGQVTELRALHLPGRRMANGFFSGDALESMAQRAVALESEGAAGVYFVPNPLRPDILGSRKAAKDEDVIARRWLLIDVDPIRRGPDGKKLADQSISSTDAERSASWDVAQAVRGTLAGENIIKGAILADSGNGWHLCCPLDLPNDDTAKEHARTMLRSLQARFGNETAAIDTTTFNASRIWKLPGTMARKGEATAERPHRYSRIIQS